MKKLKFKGEREFKMSKNNWGRYHKYPRNQMK